MERRRRLVLVAGAAVIARVVSLGSTLFLVPIVLHAYATAGFAIWTVLSVATTMLGPADLGLGMGLVVVLSGETDKSRVRAITSTALTLLCLMGAVLVLAWGVTAIFDVQWLQIVGLSKGGFSATQRLLVVGAAVASVAVAMPAQLPARIHLAVGEGHIGSWFTIAGQVAATVTAAVWALTGGSFGGFCLIAFVGPSVGGLLNFLFIASRRRHLLPTFGHTDRSARRPLFHVGLMFFCISVSGAIALQSDSIVVSQALGSDAVARFSLLARLFVLPPTLLTFASQAVLPEFSRLIATGKPHDATRLFRKVVLLATVGGAVASIVIAVAAPTAIRVWSGKSIHADWKVLAAFALWSCLTGVGPVLGTFVNAARAVRYQIVTTTAMAIVNVGLSVVLVRVIGITGPVIGTIASGILCLALPLIWWFRREFPRLAAAPVPMPTEAPDGVEAPALATPHRAKHARPKGRRQRVAPVTVNAPDTSSSKVASAAESSERQAATSQ
jgi:O-antigen/teichoic acid export membrane protein